ncbi:MAG: hypothetical protein ACXQS2_02175, partial [Methermicoccaceae archaeon]
MAKDRIATNPHISSGDYKVNIVFIGNIMRSSGDFSLNDLPGAGRMDIACRCVNSAFFLSHDLRRNVNIYLHLMGGPAPQRTVMMRGNSIRYLNPDERSAASLISKALKRVDGTPLRGRSRGSRITQPYYMDDS